MVEPPLVISEIFGPTVQGEGPDVGKRCAFVRLGRCNLSCQWCDTPYSWDWTRFDPAVELSEQSVDAVVARLATMAIDTVVLTGGEPLLQQRRVVPLIHAFRRLTWKTHVETAGTIAWDADPALVDRWVVSPKLANSGMSARRRLRYDVLTRFADMGAAFKFVVVEASDLDEVAHIVGRAGIAPTSVWIMPEGTKPRAVAERTAKLADDVIARGWNLTTRLHVLAWGDKRGR
ncbi:MAG: 7-carboxy-7-deazaguanine synthase QueE [Actinobacteria bacterium]|nr:7-carboxy-7-deazaguanine synthase QueE [Actinomycetota bacterium]